MADFNILNQEKDSYQFQWGLNMTFSLLHFCSNVKNRLFKSINLNSEMIEEYCLKKNIFLLSLFPETCAFSS